MNFALERFNEQIVINRAFFESLANELKSNNHLEGTILLAAKIRIFPSERDTHEGYHLANNERVLNFQLLS